MRRVRSLYDGYDFPGFRALRRAKGLFGDRYARVVILRRRGKKPAAGLVARSVGPTTIAGGGEFATCLLVPIASIWSWNCVVSGAATAVR
jgi:hypothetical protein